MGREGEWFAQGYTKCVSWMSLDLNLGSQTSPSASGLCYKLGFGPRVREMTMAKVHAKTCERQPKQYSEEHL